MKPEETLDRSKLMALTPSEYLRNGFRDQQAEMLVKLRGIYATAAATQLEASNVSPQELATTLEALKQVLPFHEDKTNEGFSAACQEALETVAMMYQQPNNPGIVQWLNQCAMAVKSEEDITSFLDHFLAVVRQYSIIIALKKG